MEIRRSFRASGPKRKVHARTHVAPLAVLQSSVAVSLALSLSLSLARSLARSLALSLSHFSLNSLDLLLSLPSLLFHKTQPNQDSIINPEAPLALRLSGQLLLGVVKIYSRKVGYLYSDCNDAVARIAASAALRSGGLGAGQGGGGAGLGGDVDLPEEERDATAVIASITLPEGTSGGDVADIVAALNAGGSVAGGGRFFGGSGGQNSSALDAFAASIELGGAANFSLTGDSFLIAEEVSTLLPSSMHPGGGAGNGAFDPTSAGGQGVRFALSGREIERALSGSAGAPFADTTFVDDGDVETLRDASALPDRLPPASGLFGDDGGAADGGNQSVATKMFTEGMEPPPYYDDDDDDGGGGFGGGGDDDDEGGRGGLTPSGLPPTPLDGGADGSPALVGTAALLAAANGGRPLRRKRPRLDVGAETGAPRTQLVNADIRRLLQDPGPLMRASAAAAAPAAAGAGRAGADEFGAALADLLVSNAAAARARKERSDRGRALLARPTFAPFMAPELFDAVVRCAPPPVAAVPRKPRANNAAAAGEDGELAGGPFNDGGYNDGDGGAWAGGGGFENEDDEDDYVGGGFGGIENDGESEEERGGAEDGTKNADAAAAGPSSSSAHSAAITRRTRAALDRFQGEWGSDAARGDLAAARPVSLDAVTAGATRLDAARWFFEVLVLRSRGFVDISQSQSYGDVEVLPRAMAFDEGVLGALVGGNGNGAAAPAAVAV